MSNPYAMFDMAGDVEKDGFWADYGDFRVKIARMGGKNTKYNKTLTSMGKKYKNINKKKLSEDEKKGIGNEVIVESIVTGWETKDAEDKWVPNTIHSFPSGEVVEATKENILEVLNNLDELRGDIEEQSSTKRLYLKEYQDEVVKN